MDADFDFLSYLDLGQDGFSQGSGGNSHNYMDFAPGTASDDGRSLHGSTGMMSFPAAASVASSYGSPQLFQQQDAMSYHNVNGGYNGQPALARLANKMPTIAVNDADYNTALSHRRVSSYSDYIPPSITSGSLQGSLSPASAPSPPFDTSVFARQQQQLHTQPYFQQNQQLHSQQWPAPHTSQQQQLPYGNQKDANVQSFGTDSITNVNGATPSAQLQQLLLANAQLQLQLQLQQQYAQQLRPSDLSSSHAGVNMLHGLQSPPSAAESSFGSSTASSHASNAASPVHSDISSSASHDLYKYSTSMQDLPIHQVASQPSAVPAASCKDKNLCDMSLSDHYDYPAMIQQSMSAAASNMLADTMASVADVVTGPAVPPKKATLKRSYQVVKEEEEEEPSIRSKVQASSTKALVPIAAAPGISSTLTPVEEAVSNTASLKVPGGHNAVEQKYRRGINDSLIMLREIVPALHHLRAPPGVIASKRKISQFALAASATPAAPSTLVDGVIPPKKLSKQLILVAATDYIRFLASRRAELEAEVSMLRETLSECVEDANVVFGIFEKRWTDKRRAFEEDREAIYADRKIRKKGSSGDSLSESFDSRKRAKLEDGSTNKLESPDDSNAEDDDEDDDDDEDMQDDIPVVATSSALPQKGKARARAGKSAQPGAASKGRQKSGPTAAAGSMTSKGRTGPPKALMSVFAGVSFAGGAGYDMLYGASGESARAQGVSTAEAPRVWSQGLVKRSAALLATDVTQQVNQTAALHPLQTFFLERPALLSGLVMLAMSCIISYIVFYLVPATYKTLTRDNSARKRREARSVLLAASKKPEASSLQQQRKALDYLAGGPATKIMALISLPSLILSFAFSSIVGCAGLSSQSVEVDSAETERAASATRSLELCFAGASQGGSFAAMTSFFRLYNLRHSSHWPNSPDLTIKADTIMAIAAIHCFGKYGSALARRLWQRAGFIAKKDASQIQPWVAMSVQSDLAAVIGAFEASPSPSPLFAAAEEQCKALLVGAWTALFKHVMTTTIVKCESSEDADPTTPTLMSASPLRGPQLDYADKAEQVLQTMPPTSPLWALAVLVKGVEAIGRNDVTAATRYAIALASHGSRLTSVKQYLALVNGSSMHLDDGESASDLDILASVTVSWLAVRQEASTTQDNASGSLVSIDDRLQANTLQIRKLLAAQAFSTSDEDFMDAQERCVERLVSIGRKAAGLESLSDSGCEM
ncbi:hypothetical protein EMMF5_001060 [Cystobasidiomycetes sp. EMM_F5]